MLTHKHYEMGAAPYRFIGMFSFPSTSLAESNPTAYNNMMNGRPPCARGFCEHCGMGIMNHYMLQDAEGNRFSVGSECINKMHDVENISDADHAKKQHDKKLRKARADKKREAQRVAREEKLQAERDANGGLTDYEVQREAQLAEATAKKEAFIAKVAYFIEHLSSDGFAGELKRSLMSGQEPYGRGRTIMLEMVAKTAGRKNSKAYNEKHDEAEAIAEEVFS